MIKAAFTLYYLYCKLIHWVWKNLFIIIIYQQRWKRCHYCKNIVLWILFSIHNTINLSRHKQVCLNVLRFERYFSHHWAKWWEKYLLKRSSFKHTCSWRVNLLYDVIIIIGLLFDNFSNLCKATEKYWTTPGFFQKAEWQNSRMTAWPLIYVFLQNILIIFYRNII